MSILGGMIEIGANILTTSLDDKTNTVIAQTGDVSTDDADTSFAEWWQHVGFASRPSTPSSVLDNKKRAAECIVVRQGSRDACIASKDLRGQKLYGNLRPGETAMYGSGASGKGQATVLCKDNGSVTLYTTSDNTPETGKAVYLRVSPTGLNFVAPWGSLRFDATGFHVMHASGGSFRLGGIGGPVIDQLGLGSYCTISAAMTKLESSATLVGLGPLYTPVMQGSTPATVPGFVQSPGPVTNPLVATSGLAVSLP